MTLTLCLELGLHIINSEGKHTVTKTIELKNEGKKKPKRISQHCVLTNYF